MRFSCGLVPCGRRACNSVSSVMRCRTRSGETSIPALDNRPECAATRTVGIGCRWVEGEQGVEERPRGAPGGHNRLFLRRRERAGPRCSNPQKSLRIPRSAGYGLRTPPLRGLQPSSDKKTEARVRATPRLDVCRPVSEQREVLASLGWPAPPTAGQLMRLMVADVQLSFDLERGQKINTHKTWAYSRDEYFNGDGDQLPLRDGSCMMLFQLEDLRGWTSTEDMDDATDPAAHAAPSDDARA